MTRYTFEQQNKKFVIGWDNPFKSYFIQIFDKDDDKLILNKGNGYDSHPEYESLLQELVKHGFEYQPSLIENLKKDKENSTPLTEFQMYMKNILT